MKKYLAIGLAVSALLSLFCIAAYAQGVQNVEMHGYMQNRVYSNPDSSTKIATERVSLSATGQMGKDGTAYVEVYFQPHVTDDVLGTSPNQFTAEQGRTYLESAYVDLPFAEGRIRIGKGRQLNFGLCPTYGNRKTTQYGIVAETFTQDRIIGFQWDRKFNKFDVGASVYTDYRAGTRKIGDYVGALNTVKHLVDKEDNANLSNDMAASTRFGYTTPNFQIHASAASGKLMQVDATTIGAFYGETTTNRDHNKFGLDTTYTTGPFVLQAEAYKGRFSIMEITGVNFLVGYQPKDQRRYYVRYGYLENDKPANTTQYTWNTRQLTFGLVQPIRKGVWAEFQYEKNMETPGGGAAKVKNDLMFVEFFTGF